MAKISTKLLPLIGVFLLLSLLAFFLITSGRNDPGELIPDETVSTEGPSGENFKVTLPDPDKGTTWRVEADKASLREKDDGTIRLEGLRTIFEQKDGLDFELEGDIGEINSEKNEIYLSGVLKGEISNGYTLYAKQLVIQIKENSIKSDETVTFIGPFFKITGKGLFIDLEKETLKILKDVSSNIDKESLII